MQLVALTCPGCGSPLPTAADRRVFVCRTCRASSIPRVGSEGTGGLVEIDRNLMVPAGGWPASGEIVLLPLWVFPLRRADLDPEAGTRLPAMVRVPAAGVTRTPLLLDFAVHLTRCEGEVSLQPTPPHLAEPAELGLADAFEVAEVAALAFARGWPPDGQEESVELPFGTPALIDLPCARTSVELVDLIFGRAAPAALLTAQPLPDRGRELRGGHPVP